MEKVNSALSSSPLLILPPLLSLLITKTLQTKRQRSQTETLINRWRRTVWSDTLPFLKTKNSWMCSLLHTHSRVGVQALATLAQCIVRVFGFYHHVIQRSSIHWWQLSQRSAETTISTTISSLLWRSHGWCIQFSTLHFADLLLISLEFLDGIWNKAHLVWFWWCKRRQGCTAFYCPPLYHHAHRLCIPKAPKVGIRWTKYATAQDWRMSHPGSCYLAQLNQLYSGKWIRVKSVPTCTPNGTSFSLLPTPKRHDIHGSDTGRSLLQRDTSSRLVYYLKRWTFMLEKHTAFGRQSKQQ